MEEYIGACSISHDHANALKNLHRPKVVVMPPSQTTPANTPLVT